MREIFLRRTLPASAIVLVTVLGFFPMTSAHDAETPSWGTAEPLETEDSGHAFYPQIAFDDEGNAFAVWYQSDGSQKSIWSRRYSPGLSWGEAEVISNEDSGNALGAQIVVDSSGNAIAVWSQQQGIRNVWSNRYVAGSGWGTPELIEHDDSGNASYPKISIDSSGNAVAVWNQFNMAQTSSHVWSNKYVAGAGWGDAELIETNVTGSARNPQVGMDGEGNAIVVWEQGNGNDCHIWSNRYAAGAGWGAAQLIETNDTDNTYSLDPQVALSSDGTAIAVWVNYHWGFGGGFLSLWSNEYTDGSGWGNEEVIEPLASYGNPPYVRLAMDSLGNAIAVWARSFMIWENINSTICSNRYVAGTGWGLAEPVEGNHSGNASAPEVAFDHSGNAVVVWHQFDFTRTDSHIWYNRYVVGTGWETEQLVTYTDRDCWNPTVALDSSGNAIVAWEQYNGYDEFYSVWWNGYGVLEEPSDLPHSGLLWLSVGAAIVVVVAVAVVVAYALRLRRTPPEARQP